MPSRLEEAILAAQLIERSADRPIRLCLSGGVDSEAVAIAFLAAKVPFRGVIQRFKDDLNWYDIFSAVEFCKAREIPFDFVDLDILKFYEEGRHLEYAVKYRCHSPQVAVLLHLLERVDGFPIMSWNMTGTAFSHDGHVILLFPNELNFSYDRYLTANSRRGVPFFFCYTPELIYSFLRHPKMQELMFQEGDSRGEILTYEAKCQVYRDSGFDILNRKDKYTGFENVKLHYQKLNGNDWRAYNIHHSEAWIDQQQKELLEMDEFSEHTLDV